MVPLTEIGKNGGDRLGRQVSAGGRDQSSVFRHAMFKVCSRYLSVDKQSDIQVWSLGKSEVRNGDINWESSACRLDWMRTSRRMRIASNGF